MANEEPPVWQWCNKPIYKEYGYDLFKVLAIGKYCGIYRMSSLMIIKRRLVALRSFAFLLSLGVSITGNTAVIVSADPVSQASGKVGEILYNQHCAACHDGPVARAPHKIIFSMLGPETILTAINKGIMRAQAEGLTAQQKIDLSEYLGGRAIQSSQKVQPQFCENLDTINTRSTPASALNGWGFGLGNNRAIDAKTAGLSASDVGLLKLKWAFAYPSATRARSQPIANDGTLFVGSQDGTVYALDLDSGCAYWTFKADTEVRNALSLGSIGSKGSDALFFGDFAGSIYALDRGTGTLLWKVAVNDHPDTTITGSPKLHDNILYVPLSSREWASAANPAYPCCTFRGGVVALHVADGSHKWTAFSIDEPQPTGKKNSMGAVLQAPSGAPIWNSPTIDVKRNRLYVGTGESYSSPAASTSDAVLAFDLDDGSLLWSYQSLAKDAWNMACFVGGKQGNCPSENGPDLDIGASVILQPLSTGKDLLLVGQKSGHVFALDPDKKGKLLWKKKIGIGGFAGGVHWGMTAMGNRLYAAIADSDFGLDAVWKGTPGLYAINATDGHVDWYSPVTDRCRPGTKPVCDQGLSAAITSIPGVVFAGAYDGFIRAFGQDKGEVIWEYQTNRSFDTISGMKAHGGAIEADGPVVIDGVLLVNSGYSFGSRLPGNVLLAFSVEGK